MNNRYMYLHNHYSTVQMLVRVNDAKTQAGVTTAVEPAQTNEPVFKLKTKVKKGDKMIAFIAYKVDGNLVKFGAVSLARSDDLIIRQGNSSPRVTGRKLAEERLNTAPVVLQLNTNNSAHEVCHAIMKHIAGQLDKEQIKSENTFKYSCAVQRSARKWLKEHNVR